MRRLSAAKDGFTIVELMIATIVFSVLLLIATYGIINIGKLYRKSLTSNQTQQNARAIIDKVSQNIKFTGGGIVDGNGYYCLGPNVRLSYVLDQQVNNGTHAMVFDNINCSSTTGAKDLATLNTGDKELLAPNMRIAKFFICYQGIDTATHPDCSGISIGQDDLYFISVKVVYGDDDLLTPDHQNCTLAAGREFCAVSELNTYVQKVL